MIKNDSKKKDGERSHDTDKCKEKIEQLENQLRRALADYQNLEKRQAEERHEWIKTANKQLILRLLPTLDILILAGRHGGDQGLQLGIKQFLDTLKSEGVEKIQTQGKAFDPITMECVETREGEGNKVLEEVRSGYMQFDKVLRPAQVVVGKGT